MVRNIVRLLVLIVLSVISFYLIVGVAGLLQFIVNAIPFNESVMWLVFFLGGSISIATLFVLDKKEV